MTIPSYLYAENRSKLKDKISEAGQLLERCTICPRHCQVNRLQNVTGICHTGRLARVSAYAPHFGEEAPISGVHGSGTIFFTYCSLNCVFCQNHEISQSGRGDEVTSEELANMMLSLQKSGCHNINFVTPSHVVPQVLSALEVAIDRGLNIPLIYNSSGYDSVHTIQLLEGVFDMYMPDVKFWNSGVATATCKAPDYALMASASIKEMHRQVGDLLLDEDGIAVRGLLIRHLVMPGYVNDSENVMQFIANQISKNTYVNIMAQYHPSGDAYNIENLSRHITPEEYARVVQSAQNAGLTRID